VTNWVGKSEYADPVNCGCGGLAESARGIPRRIGSPFHLHRPPKLPSSSIQIVRHLRRRRRDDSSRAERERDRDEPRARARAEAVILGNSNTPGALGYVMPLLDWAMPSKYHSIHKNDLARAMVAQSEQAFLAIAQGDAPKEPTVKILEYKEMEPFFVRGESEEP